MSDTKKAPLQQRSPRRGSSFSDRQIAYAVRDGRQVRVTLSTGGVLAGWVCGMDDYHWGLVETTGEVHLVHKAAPRLSIGTHRVDDLPEDERQAIEAVVGPFREHVMRHHFKHSPN